METVFSHLAAVLHRLYTTNKHAPVAQPRNISVEKCQWQRWESNIRFAHFIKWTTCLSHIFFIHLWNRNRFAFHRSTTILRCYGNVRSNKMLLVQPLNSFFFKNFSEKLFFKEKNYCLHNKKPCEQILCWYTLLF